MSEAGRASSSGGRRPMMIALLILLVAALALLLWQFPPTRWDQARHWGAWLESQGIAGMALLLAGGWLATAVGLPRQLVAFVAGFAYGVAVGFGLSLLAAVSGCALTFVVSRRYLRSPVSRRFPAMLEALDRFVRTDPFLKTLILRLQPLGTNLVTNLCAGVTGIEARAFLVSSAVGYVPQMLVFVLLGSGVRVGSNTQLAISAALFVISLALGRWVWRRHRRTSAL